MQPIPTRLFCTVVTRSYLPYARCLASTLACSGNPEPLHVLVADAEAALRAGQTAGSAVSAYRTAAGLGSPANRNTSQLSLVA